jgi:hypothetical protein
MSATLLKSIIAFIPAVMLLFGAILLFRKDRRASSLMQLLGAVSFLLVIFAHIFEALQWFPAMGWGQEHSVGHYLDLAGATLGATLFPLGYLLHARERRTV